MTQNEKAKTTNKKLIDFSKTHFKYHPLVQEETKFVGFYPSTKFSTLPNTESGSQFKLFTKNLFLKKKEEDFLEANIKLQKEKN
jgi:hypothetical protein